MTQNNSNRKETLLKGVIIAGLFLLLLVPMALVRDLIGERQKRKQQVVMEIGSKWGKEQQIKGPVVAIHHENINEKEYKGSKGKSQIEYESFPEVTFFAPEHLNVTAHINPSVRRRSIFETVIYESGIQMEGHFGDLKSRTAQLKNIDWSKTEIYVGLSDLRGLKTNSLLKLNDTALAFSGSGAVDSVFGSAVKADLGTDFSGEELRFEINIESRGSERLSFVPLARENDFQVNSGWGSPGFDGAFLPEKHEITKEGFSAQWSISHLNRNLPDRWKEESLPAYEEAAFGVSLLQPNDNYQKADRSAKYALLVIGLTFLSFFFIELLNGLHVHPFQYVLVGVALCLFYVLLLAISEVLRFNYAYLLSSGMILGLIWLYAKSVFGTFSLSTLVTAIMTGLYIYIFTIIQLEDRALLVGSLGLFVILSLTMYFSKKVDWKNL